MSNKVTNPISFMIGKGTSFTDRPMSTVSSGAFPVQRSWTPTTALVRADALGFTVTRVTELEDLLRWATRALAHDNRNLLLLEALLRQPSLPSEIAKVVYPRDIQPVDASVPVITFSDFQDGIRSAVTRIDPLAASTPGIVEIITYTYGRPAIEQGFVMAARDMVDIELSSDLIPDYASIKSAGLATLLEHALEGVKLSFTGVSAKRVVARLMFDTLREALMVICESLITLRFKWESFDALAAVAVAKLTGHFDDKPDRISFLKNPDVDAFCQNFTLVTASLAYFSGDKRIATQIPLLAEADAYTQHFRGLVSAITQSPLLKTVPLSAFAERTHISRLMAPNKLLLALIMEPAFSADPTAQVSYLANTTYSQGMVLTPMPDIELHVRGLFGPAATMAKLSIVDLHNVVQNAVLDDGDALAAEAGAAIQLSAGTDVTMMSGMAYAPDLLTKNMSDEYIAHVGAAFSSYVAISSLEDDLAEPELSYFFTPTTPDLHYLTTPIATGIAATFDPALVIALKGQPDVAITRASDSWILAPQVLDDRTRRSLIVGYKATGDLALFPDEKNTLDRHEDISLTLSKDAARVMNLEALSAKVSLFELFGGTSFPDGTNAVQVHYNPVLSMQVTGLLTMLASLFDRATNDRGRQAALTAAVKAFQPLLQSREYQIAYRGLLTHFARQAASPSQRMYLMRSLANSFDVVELQVSLIFVILLRTRLLSHSTYETLAKSKLWRDRAFKAALATSVAV